MFIKTLIFLAFIYILVGVVIEVVDKKKKDKQLEFNLEALKLVISWPKILF
jgi:hypothetical protein